MKTLLLAVAALLLASAAPLYAADKDDAYLVDKKNFKRQYKTIALSPVDFDPSLQMPERVGTLLEQEITRHLEKRGYKVLPSTVLGDIRKTMATQVGGYVEAASGGIDVDKFKAVRRHSMRELWFRHELDAIATIRVMASKVPIDSDRVEWHGTKQKIETSGGRRKYTADVFVSSVTFAVYDQTDKLLFIYDGGLEPLMRREGDQLLPMTSEHFFTDDKRIRSAAKIAVSPI